MENNGEKTQSEIAYVRENESLRLQVKTLTALAEKYRGLLIRSNHQMKAINGDDSNCKLNNPKACPNHALINEVDALLSLPIPKVEG